VSDFFREGGGGRGRGGATYLEELLDDVVAEHVHHELVGGLQDLAEHQLALGRAGALQLQLDEPARRERES